MIPKLTARQSHALRFCNEYARKNGYAVSIRELQEELKASYGTVRYTLLKLEELGYIEFYGSRMIKVLHLP